MISGKINLHIDYSKAGVVREDDYQPYLEAYIRNDQAEKKLRPAVIVCPGGAYEMTSDREAECVALKFLSAGFQSFVLRYSTKPAVFPMALMELAQSVKVVRDHAGDWNIDPDKIIVAGFSAGGHLAASLACMWNQGFLAESLGITDEIIRPNGSLLCYPVITSGEKAHRGSFENLLRGLPEEMMDAVSLEKHVNKGTPPTFIWATWTDDLVPVENTLLYVRALKKHDISAEVHIFPQGRHGLSLADPETVDHEWQEKDMPEIGIWIDLAITWIRNL